MYMIELYKKFKECSHVSIDTRTLQNGCLFFCIKGANFNGNKFAEEALNKGAKFVVIDDEDYFIDQRTILVENSLKALQDLASYHRSKLSIPIIGITGSNGKTTTKELIGHLLSQKFNVLYTAGNFNNHIGVPLTLFRINENHDMAIIEMGANQPNDIQELCEIAAPTFGIITNIGKAHLLGFKNLDGVIKTKTALYRYIAENNGTLFVNLDDEILLNNIPHGVSMITYSTTGKTVATVQGKLDKLTPLLHLSWQNESYNSPTIATQIIGEYNFFNLVAAITIADYFKVDSEQINKGIESYVNENNRSQLVKTTTNEMILDAYNANPTSMRSAIQSFAKIDRTTKIMVLGDMFELGEETFKEHQAIVHLVEQTKIPCYFIGEHFYEHASSPSFFKTKEEFIVYLSENSITNSFLLIKGSRGIALEKITAYL